MRYSPLCLKVCAAALLAVLCVSAAQAAPSRLPSVSTESTAVTDRAALDVRAFGDNGELEGLYGGAEVYIDGSSAGWTRYSSDSILPGTYLIEVRARGYYASSITLTLSAGTRYKLIFSLQPLTGIADIEVEPSGAALSIDGNAVGPGSVEIKTGSHQLRAALFGWETQLINFDIAENSVTKLSIALRPAAFSVDNLSLSQSRFNPLNSGRFGGETIGFEVSSFGSADLSIEAPSGETVFQKHFASFDTWKQAADWNGKTAEGQPFADGLYTVRLRAWAAGSGPDSAPLELKESFTIDSSLVIGPFESQGGSRGLLYMGNPWPIATRLCSASIKAEEAADLSAAPFINFAFQFESSAFGIGAEAAFRPESGSAAFSAALGFRYSFSKSNAAFAWAGQVRALYSSSSSAASGCETGASSAGFGVEAALPFAFRTGILKIGLEPGGILTIPLSGTVNERLLLGGGLWLGGSVWEAGLSGKALCAADSSFGLAAPLYAAIEGRCFAGPDSFIISGGATAAIEPGVSADFGITLGFGLIF